MPRAKFWPGKITTIYEDRVSAAVRERYMSKINRESLRLISDITGDMRNRIGDVLRAGIEEGKSVAATASTLLTTGLDRGVFRSARKRAWLIARTELHRARQQAAIDVYRANGIKLVKWVAITDGRICPVCQGREGRIFRLSRVRKEWLPPIHPRCRCRVIPSDFDFSITVKQNRREKVVETKIAPNPIDYLYVIKLKKAMEVLEKSDYDYNSTQVELPKDLAEDVLDIVKLVDKDDLHPTEKQDDAPHITVLYGLHKNSPKLVKDLLESIGSIKASISVVDIFQPKGRDYDVLIHRIDSPELHQLNQLLKQLPYSSDFSFYEPHITITYLKRGAGDKYLNLVSGLEGTPVEFTNIIFSSKGGKKTPINLEKAKPYTRVRRGKLERVKGYPGRPSYLGREFKRPKFFSEDEWKELFPWTRQRLERAYKSSAEVWEGYTIGQHTEMAVKQFDKYFGKEEVYAPILGSKILRNILLLHDIGKAEAIRDTGNKKDQYEYNRKVVETILPEMGVDRIKLIRVAKSLVSQDWIGDYLQGKLAPKVVAEWMYEEAKELNVPILDYYKLCRTYFMCDAGSYTKDAGGKEALDYMFSFDPKYDLMLFKGEFLEKTKDLEQYINVQSIKQRKEQGEYIDLYHGTSYEFLNSIMEEGLRSGHYRNFDMELYDTTEREHVVFVAENFSDAAYFARRAADNTGEPPVVLQVKVPRDWFEQNAKDDDHWPGNAVMFPIVQPSWIVKAYGLKPPEEKPESLIGKISGVEFGKLSRAERDALLTKEIEQDYKEVWEKIRKAKDGSYTIYVPIGLETWRKYFEPQLTGMEKAIQVKPFTRVRRGKFERVKGYGRVGLEAYYPESPKPPVKDLSKDTEELVSSILKRTGFKDIVFQSTRYPHGYVLRRFHKQLKLLSSKIQINGRGKLTVVLRNISKSDGGARYGNNVIEMDDRFISQLGHEYAHFLFDNNIGDVPEAYFMPKLDELHEVDQLTERNILGLFVDWYETYNADTSEKKAFKKLIGNLASFYASKWKEIREYLEPVREWESIARAKLYILFDLNEIFSRAVNTYVTQKPSPFEFKKVEDDSTYFKIVNSWGDSYLKTGIVKSLLEKAVPVKGFIRTRRGKRERVKPYQRGGRKHPEFFAGTRRELKELKEEFEEKEPLLHLKYEELASPPRTEEERKEKLKRKKVDPEQEAALKRLFAMKSMAIDVMKNKMGYSEKKAELMFDLLTKAIQVKGFFRTRKGKRGWVKPHHREALEIQGKIPEVKTGAPTIDSDILHPDVAEKAWIKVSKEFTEVKDSVKYIDDSGPQQGYLHKVYMQGVESGYRIGVGSGFARQYFKGDIAKFYEVSIRHELLHAEAERLGLKETPELEREIDKLAREEYKGGLKKPWTKEDAEKHIKEIEPLLKENGYEVVGIVGGVAKKGFSKHDLDIVIRPTREDFNFEPIYMELGGDFTGGLSEDEPEEYYQYWDKHGRIVDLIFEESEEIKVPKVEGVEYVGIQRVPEEEDLYLFNEVKTGFTFATKDLSKESIIEGRDKVRTKFEKSKKFVLDLKKSRTKLVEFRKSKVIGKVIPYRVEGKTCWAKVFKDGFLVKGEPEFVKIRSNVLVKSGVAEVIAIGKDGVTARGSDNRKYQIQNKDVRLWFRR